MTEKNIVLERLKGWSLAFEKELGPDCIECQSYKQIFDLIKDQSAEIERLQMELRLITEDRDMINDINNDINNDDIKRHRQDAIDGQNALEEANNRIVELETMCREAIEYANDVDDLHLKHMVQAVYHRKAEGGK